ncbi:MAG TPA: hypothetical protein VFW25_01180 [Silvibacterium sp.]|nr:hypothetical protein [Silvibacterium sp.]
MLDRMKPALVESYVGAIGLGYLLAETILHFVSIFSSPVAGWFARYEYLKPLSGMRPPSPSPLEFAVPQVVEFVLLSVLWYILLRWLYFSPVKRETAELAPDLNQAD